MATKTSVRIVMTTLSAAVGIHSAPATRRVSDPHARVITNKINTLGR